MRLQKQAGEGGKTPLLDESLVTTNLGIRNPMNGAFIIGNKEVQLRTSYSMTRTKTELKGRIRQKVIADSITIDDSGDELVVNLLYHEPETHFETVEANGHFAIAVCKPQMDIVMAELLDDIYEVTKPDRLDVEDKGGYYVVQLTYHDGHDW